MPLLFGHTPNKLTSEQVIPKYHPKSEVNHLLLAGIVVVSDSLDHIVHLPADPQGGAHPLI